MPRTDPPLFAGLPYRRLSPAQRAALAARLVGARARPRPIRVLDCFSGIGGLALAAESAGMEIVAFVEIDAFCRRVLAAHWPDVRRYGDIRDVSADRLRADGCWPVDLVAGGFPCQPHSVAGKRRAADDDRDLWPELRRVVRLARPRWVVAENVPGLRSSDAGRFFGAVLGDLADLGYRVGWASYGADAVGAPHRRERVFIVAHTDDLGRQRSGGRRAGMGAALGGWGDAAHDASAPADAGADLADANGDGWLGGAGDRERGSVLPDAGGRSAQSCAERGGWRRGAGALHGALADAASGARQRPASGRAGHPALGDQGGVGLADADRLRCDPVLGRPQIPSRRSAESTTPGSERSDELPDADCEPLGRPAIARAQRGDGGAQPGVCRGPHGLPAGLDGRWPARPGEPQAAWEAPRTVTERVPERGDKLRALGNAVVPMQAAPIFAAIAAYEREEASA